MPIDLSQFKKKFITEKKPVVSFEKEKIKDKKTRPEKKQKGKEYLSKKSIPKGYMLIKIPENLNDLRIGKLRSLHADIFGKEPPHDSAHNKEWIASKIKKILSN